MRLCGGPPLVFACMSIEHITLLRYGHKCSGKTYFSKKKFFLWNTYQASLTNPSIYFYLHDFFPTQIKTLRLMARSLLWEVFDFLWVFCFFLKFCEYNTSELMSLIC